MTFPNVVIGWIVSMVIVSCNQSIWGLCFFNHGNSRIISSFLRSVTRNLVGMFHFLIFWFNQIQCLMTPDLFLVLLIFSSVMFLSSGVRAIFHSRMNFLSMKVLSPCTSNGTINDFLFSFANSTGEIEIELGAGANVRIGHFFKNPCFQGHQWVWISYCQRVLYISPWSRHRHQWLWYKREEDGSG